MSPKKLKQWYDTLKDENRKNARSLALLSLVVGLLVGALLVSVASADAAVPRAKMADRLMPASTNAGASLLEPLYACEVLDDIEGRVDDVSLPGRPQVGDTIRDQFQRERTIRSVKVRWSEGRAATQYQAAVIACTVQLDPP